MKFCFSFLALLLFCSSSTVVAEGSRQGDSLALVALYNATGGPSWTSNDNWLTTKPIDEWYAVQVDKNRVVAFNLEANNLVGTLPKEIGNLDMLELIRVSNNNLSGSIPEEIGGCTALQLASFTTNKLSGPIPKSLFNCSNLWHLGLGGNALSGQIPKEIGNLKKLVNLYIWSTEVSGSIPAEIGDLSSLELVQIADNKNLIGILPPELGKLTNLKTLQIHGNSITGAIPKELGNLVNVVNITLNENKLSGEIPPELSQLESLDTLFLRNNQLSGSLPKELGSMQNLRALSVRDNQLSGTIPPEFKQMKKLVEFRCSNNSITGGLANLPKNPFDFLWIFGNPFNFDELEIPHTASDYQFTPMDSLGSTKQIVVSNSGDEFTLSADEAGVVSTSIFYQWFKDGVEINGASSRLLSIPSFTKANEGMYSYEATDPFYVPNLTLYRNPVKVLLQSSVGVDDDFQRSGFTLSPNPCNNQVRVSATDGSILSYRLFDQMSNEVSASYANTSNAIGGTDMVIDTKNLHNGVYQLQLVANNRVLTTRFVVCH